MSRINLMLKALCELGPRQLGLYAWYKFSLRSGYLRYVEGRKWVVDNGQMTYVLDLPTRDELFATLGDEGIAQVISQADEIVDGQVRLFGGDPVPLDLTPSGELSHWTEYELGRTGVGDIDIKYIWEPARFGWVFTLGRAYHLTGDERYPESFWRYFEIFHSANPVNMGPNWVSAQEVALRIIALVFAAQIFSPSNHSSAPRTSHLSTAIAQHAARILPSLIYARAQNNNHLLSEAAGLITASLALPDHHDATCWSRLGWKWFNRGLETQIAADGAYMQQSTNYHRLMLQLSLWISSIHQGELDNTRISERSTHNLQRATQWLLSLTDLESGRTPNLGPNDGAYILPLTVAPYHDYRPVLQAASQVFLGKPAIESGPWDEMCQWLFSGIDYQVPGEKLEKIKRDTWYVAQEHSPSTLHASQSWAYLRAATFHDRPGHADQLHLDLWWRGLNVAQDAGTYLYNADPPWENALTHTAVHNTIMVDGIEQMTRAGRFLYVDKAQAEIVSRDKAENCEWESIVATHDGYRRLGVIHHRTVTAHQNDHWVIEDQLLPAHRTPHTALHTVRLHWLLPDWEWKIDSSGLKVDLLSPYGWIGLNIQSPIRRRCLQSSIIRAGEVLYGEMPAHPTLGWTSPTYGVKIPALSFSISVEDSLPISLSSEWVFPTDE